MRRKFLSKANVIIFYSACDKGSKAFVWGNFQNIYDYTFSAKTILFFWHILIWKTFKILNVIAHHAHLF